MVFIEKIWYLGNFIDHFEESEKIEFEFSIKEIFNDLLFPIQISLTCALTLFTEYICLVIISVFITNSIDQKENVIVFNVLLQFMNFGRVN